MVSEVNIGSNIIFFDDARKQNSSYKDDENCFAPLLLNNPNRELI